MSSSGNPKKRKRPAEDEEDEHDDEEDEHDDEDSKAHPKQQKFDGPKFDKTRVVRVYADGIFDLFHFGHARALQQCKELFPKVHLIVGVCDDALTNKMKGKTVMDEYERAESLRHCRYVDEVIEHAPWFITPEYMEKHQIDCVAHDGDPYPTSNSDDVYTYVKSIGKFVPTQRTEGISTSDIINRLIRDYDKFVRRNLDRGYSRKEMNVSFVRAQRIKAAARIEKIGDTVKEKGEEVIDDSQKLLQKWLDNSQKFVDDFLQLFGRHGTLNRYVKDRTKSFEEGIKKIAQNTPM